MSNNQKNQSGLGAVEAILILVIIGILGFTGWFVWHSKQSADKTLTANNSAAPIVKKQAAVTTATSTHVAAHTSSEAVTLVQTAYDTYLKAVNMANSDSTRTQPVAQVGLAAVEGYLTTGVYSKAAAVTQATPFSCTSQYVTDKYSATLASSDKSLTIVAVSISNGAGLSTTGMTVTVDLSSLKITNVNCPS